MELKAPDLDNLCGSGGKLNDKLALTLSKYLFKAFDLIGKRDQRKYNKFAHPNNINDTNLIFIFSSIELISLVQNGQHLIKVQLKIKEKMGNCCILKAQFEKYQILDVNKWE